MHILFMIITGLGIIIIGGCACIVCRALARAWREINAHKRVEARFLDIWDHTATHELLAWAKVRRQLLVEGAPKAEQQAVRKRIEICKERHRSYRKVKLQGGRTVIISTLN